MYLIGQLYLRNQQKDMTERESLGMDIQMTVGCCNYVGLVEHLAK